jgi:UDP-perosamine 4-acetyltransferase
MSIKEVIVVGAGGHAKVVIELLRQSGNHVAYCISGEEEHKECLGVPILLGDKWIENLRAEGFCRAFVAIGSNRTRLRMAGVLKQFQYELVNAISPFASISPSARIATGVAVMAGVVINAEAEIGDFSIINTGATIDHDCRIGQAVHVAPQSALAGTITVGDGAFLGIGCRVLPGLSIGEWSIVGAGAVVTKNIPANVTAVGVPAKVLS